MESSHAHQMAALAIEGCVPPAADQMSLTPRTIEIGGVQFAWVCRLDPERDKVGNIRDFKPQARYKNADRVPINRYGAGPFCRFRIPSGFPFSGVYALTIGGEIRYVGECVHLSRRFGPQGYGSIQPRNCFAGGQATNCKINNLILTSAIAGDAVDLWFHRTDHRKELEAALIAKISPPWNGRIAIQDVNSTKTIVISTTGINVLEGKDQQDNGRAAMTGQLAERIRRHANEAFIEPARRAGRKEVVIVAGDVHKDLRLESRMPAVCGALDTQKFQTEYRVVLTKRTGPHQGSTVTWIFEVLP